MPIGYFADHELITELGRGDMGVVYKARDPSRSRLVALKMLRAGARADPEDLRRFESEAKIAARLDHPHIVPIFGLGMDDGCKPARPRSEPIPRLRRSNRFGTECPNLRRSAIRGSRATWSSSSSSAWRKSRRGDTVRPRPWPTT